MLTLWRRHNPAKCRLTKRTETKCRCVIWATGTLPNGRPIRESTKLRDWTRAQTIIRQWEIENDVVRSETRTKIADWKLQFLQDAKSPSGRNLSPETYRKYVLLFKQLEKFAEDKGLKFVDQLDLQTLTMFRGGWKDAPLSASKKLERLRNALKFALRRKWVKENSAEDLDFPKLKASPTLPFSEEEENRILEHATAPRDRAFVLVMRHSGLRISDTTTLAVASLNGSKIRLYQAKTGEHVSVPIPDKVAAALRGVKHSNPKYFFWSGHSKIQSATSVWRKRLADIFEEAKIDNGHTHRFRDTFAVRLLEKGVSLETVSILLGHQSVKITQKHYSPWVKTRQEALEREVFQALSA
jgi:site-specific recombinase XerD